MSFLKERLPIEFIKLLCQFLDGLSIGLFPTHSVLRDKMVQIILFTSSALCRIINYSFTEYRFNEQF